jgi:hypothetical protein
MVLVSYYLNLGIILSNDNAPNNVGLPIVQERRFHYPTSRSTAMNMCLGTHAAYALTVAERRRM